jgi:hypothetical protein
MADDQEGQEALANIDLEELLNFFPIETEAQAAVEKRLWTSLCRVYDELQTE